MQKASLFWISILLGWLRKPLFFFIMHMISIPRKTSHRPKHIWTLAGVVHCTNSFIQLVSISSSLNKNWTMLEATVIISVSSSRLLWHAVNVKIPVTSLRINSWPKALISTWSTIFTPLQWSWIRGHNMVQSCYHKKGFPQTNFLPLLV